MGTVYRICKARYPVYDATGSYRVGGRWTSPGLLVLYTAEHYASAILEQIAHAGRVALPGAHHAAAIDIPDSVRPERFDFGAHPGWSEEGSNVARRFGDEWARSSRSPVLYVPSVPAHPVEWNVLINLSHADASGILAGPAFDVLWDGRLFGPTIGQR